MEQKNKFAQLFGGEDIARRDANVKHYDLGRGYHQAVIYPEPVHYMDDDNTWKDIDNTLVEATDDRGRRFIKNTGNPMHAQFNAGDDDTMPVAIEHNGVTFSWGLFNKNAAYAPAVRQGAELRREKLIQRASQMPRFAGRTRESLMQLKPSEIHTPQELRNETPEKLDSQICYADALPGVSLRYSLHGNTVKEDIIVADAAALHNAAIRLPEGFYYNVEADAAVTVRDTAEGEELFRFDPPVVYDAAQNTTVAAVQIVPAEDGDGYRMTYVIDPAFLATAVYPIIIDPVVHTSASYNTPVFNTLAEGAPGTNFSTVNYMAIGFQSGNEGVGLLKFNNLTGLAAGSTIIQAVVYLYPKSSSSSKYIAVHKVNKAWTASACTWNSFNPDSTANIAAEEIECVQCSSSGAIGFNITNLCRDWVRDSSTNFGIAFRSPKNISGDNYSELYSSTASSSYQPVMYVNYVSHAGLEDWWQYESRSAGRAGTVYAELFNGNSVVAHTDTVMNGNIMPVSVSHFYNGCLSSTNDYNCGYGWKTSLHQTVEVVDHNDQSYYVWTDGDGTKHYFLFSDFNSQPFEDCEGMGLKLTHITGAAGVYTDDIITIEDKGHNQMIFTGTGYYKSRLTSIKDSVGNTATVSYDASGRISKATDGVGRETVFTYSNSLLANIRIPDTSATTYRYVYFTYDSTGRLTGVRYSDLGGSTNHTTYSYTTSGGYQLLTRARNFDGVAVNVAYDSMKRVASLETVALNASNAVTKYGSKQIFDYKHMETQVTAVETTANDTGKKLYYQFNDSGNVVSVRDDLGFGSFTKFESGIENKPSQSSRLRKAVINLLRKPDWSAGWTNNKNGSTIQITVDNNTRCLGMPGGKFVNTAGTDGYCRQQVTIEKGKDYTMSCYMKLSSVTGNGAYLRILPVTSGAFTAQTSAYRNGSTAAAIGNGMANDGWERIHFTFNIPGSGTVNAYFEMGTNATGGTAWLCCPQIEVGTIANPVNLISNGDFHLSAASGSRQLPTDWTEGTNVLQNTMNGVLARGNDTTIPTHLSGNYVQLEGVPNKTYICYTQQINMAGSAGDAVVLGGWAKGQAVPDSDSATRGFGLAARIKKTDGTWSDYWFCPFNEEWTSWQYASFGAPCKYDYTMIEVGIVYNKNCNYAKFSNIFLHREEFGQTYTYDENKNPISTKSLSSQQSNATYDSADNMTSYVQGGMDPDVADNKYIFYYGGTDAEREKHLLLRTCTPMKQTDYFGYDAKGNRTSSRRIDYRVYSEGTAENAYPFIRTEATYTSDSNYVATQKDARGNTVTTDTNAYDGSVSKITDPTGQAVTYNYDASKRVTAVNATANSKTYKNTYTYENDRIKTVSHNTTGDTPDVTYSFGYDALGRKATVKVGTQTLSTNVYENDRNGLLSEVQYGNGGKVAYTYDEFDRMTGVKHDGATTASYTYEYGANGSVGKLHDNILDREAQTEYDLADRPVSSTLRDANGNVIQRELLAYDIQNRLSNYSEVVNGATYKNIFTYDRDNRVTKIVYDDGNEGVGYTYDELGRTSARIINVVPGLNSARLNTTYGYVAGGHGTNSTTSLVQTITHDSANFDRTYTYGYDSRGNIVSENYDGKTISYVYDGLGQLIRVNDQHSGETWVYNYDRGGNITSKVKYAYTTGTLGSAVQTIPYTYGDANWKDKLTAYNGVAISHDAIGNPLNDGTWNYEWQHGRQLKRMYNATGEIIYKYDHNGLRVEKQATVNGVAETTRYTISGKNITHMTVGNDMLHFYYDAMGRPCKVRYNGTIYSYVHNLQGDIVAILDSNGNAVVQYRYDAWGNLKTTYGTMAATLGKRNPFRYRGYVYDVETGLYYLMSRYYSCTRCVFINSDNFIDASCNMFNYCQENPVSMRDDNGHSPTSVFTAMDSGGKKQALKRSIDYSTLNAKYNNANCIGFSLGRNRYILQIGSDDRRNYYSYRDKDGMNAMFVHMNYYNISGICLTLIEELGGEENARLVSGPDAEVPDGWHMIAIRSGWNLVPPTAHRTSSDLPASAWYCVNDPNGGYTSAEIHVMVLYEGEWIHKPGSTKIVHINGVTPEDASAWGMAFENFQYTSPVRYMIIRGGI